MSIEFNESKNLILVWLTNEDQHNPTIDYIIGVLRDRFANSKTRLVIYRSGNDDLTLLSQALLSRNKNIISALEE